MGHEAPGRMQDALCEVENDGLPFWSFAAHEERSQLRQYRRVARLLDLPAELLSAITSWLLRPQDLAKTCLVSKRLQEIAMPELYRSLHVNVDRWRSEHLGLITTSGHPGHQYIRSLDIDSVHLRSESQALEIAKKLLECVSQDQLQCFRCPLESGLDKNAVISLFTAQRKLKYTALGPFCDSLTRIDDVGPFHNTTMDIDELGLWPDHVNTVVIPWKLLSIYDLTFYRRLIERRNGNLHALTVRAHDFTKSSQQAMGNDALATGLFSPIYPYKGAPHVELHDLNLQNQDLSRSEETWLRFVNFSRLQTLQIWNCDALDALLIGMQKLLAENETTELHGLVLSCEEQTQAPTLAAKYIASTSGLRYLNLCYVPVLASGPGPKFDIKCLQPHGETLSDLFLGIGSNQQDNPSLYVPTLDEFAWLSTHFKQLKQLAIPLPHCAMGSNTGGNLLAGEWGDYGIALTRLAALPRLKILRILTWPQIHYHGLEFNSGAMNAHRTQYLKNLDTVATSIARLFSQLRGDECDRLSVITFGHAEWPSYINYVDGDGQRMFEQPITYKIRRFMTEFGLCTEVERNEIGQMEQEEPIGFVVDEDTDQGLSLAAYS